MSGAEIPVALAAAETAGATTAAASTAAAMEAAAIAAAATEAATAAAVAEGATTAGMAAAANTGLPAAATIPTGYVNLSPSLAAELGLSGPSALGTEGASGNVLANVYGASSPYKISPMQAMAMSRAMGGFGQQDMGTRTQNAPFKPGQPVNLADPIASLLAPKRKKERPMISLL